MTFDPDDPRLTAFALGELEGPERAAIESLLERDPDARQFVELTQQLAHILGSQLRSEPLQSSLTDSQRWAIEQAAAHAPASPAVPRFPRPVASWPGRALAAAALLALGVGTYSLWHAKYGPVAQEPPAPAHPQAIAPSSPISAPPIMAPAAESPAFSAPSSDNGPPAPFAAAGAAAEAPAADSPTSLSLPPRLSEPVDRSAAGPAHSPFSRESPHRAESAAAILPDHPTTAPDPIDRDSTPPLDASHSAPSNDEMFARSLERENARAGHAAPRSDLGFRRGRATAESASSPPGAPSAHTLSQLPATADLTTAPKAPTGPDNPILAPSAARLGHVAAVAAGRPPDSSSTSRTPPFVVPAPEFSSGRPGFTSVRPDQTVLTLSTDVGTQSYAQLVQSLSEGRWPPPDAIRLEELINAIPYLNPPPPTTDPLAIACELTEAPWNPRHWLLRIGLRARSLPPEGHPPTYLVFVVDLAESPQSSEPLSLFKGGLLSLADNLGHSDTVSILSTSAPEPVLLTPTAGADKSQFITAIGRLQPGGSVNPHRSIERAFRLAAEASPPTRVRRVVLATDGSLLADPSALEAITRLAQSKVQTGVPLTVLGLTPTQLRSARLKQIAERVNGTYHDLDSPRTAHLVLPELLAGTQPPIATNATIDVDFNPASIRAYRLIGYQPAPLAPHDPPAAARPAGTVRAGSSLTALIELVPAHPLSPSQPEAPPNARHAPEDRRPPEPAVHVTVSVKTPDRDAVRKWQTSAAAPPVPFAAASDDTRFASAVALFGMFVKYPSEPNIPTLDAIVEIAKSALDSDPGGHRASFLTLLRRAEQLQPAQPRPTP